MSSQESILGELLNDESFVRWLKKDTDSKETEKWERWISEDSRRKKLVAKARKFLDMPFQSAEVTAGTKKQEHQKLVEQIKVIENIADFEEE